MSIGLAGDAAVANTHLGFYCNAVAQLADCLERLHEVDPTQSLNKAYVHRVVRHAILWVQSRIRGEITTHPNGEPVEMVTGACSNPEPPEAIAALPLSPLELAWYMLAKCDFALGGDAGVARGLDERLRERTIPALEISFRFDAVISAIKTGDTADFTSAVVRWLSAASYLSAHYSEVMGEGSVSTTYGVVPDLKPEQRRDSIPSEAAIAAVRALAIYSITAGRQLSVTELVSSLEPQFGEDHPAVKLLLCLERASPYIDPSSSLTTVLSNLAAGAPRTPEDSLIGSIHLLELTSRLDYRRVLEEPVSRWIAAEWTKIANTQQFAISSPRINGPAILEAVARSSNDLASAAEIILTALPAVKTRIHPDLRMRLEEIRNGVQLGQ